MSSCDQPCENVLRMVRGDTKKFVLTVVLNGQRQDLTGCSLTWVANSHHPDRYSRIVHSTDDGGVVISSGQSPPSPTTGQATLTLESSDTARLANEHIRFRTNWVLVDALGAQTTIDRDEELVMSPNV